MNKHILIVLNTIFTLMVTQGFSIFAQNIQCHEKNTLVVGFYNLENLFDTQNDPSVKDEDFLPSGFKGWNAYKFNSKINNLAKAIIMIGDLGPPDIMGVCEVENSYCLEKLLFESPLKKWNMKYVHEDSRDRRGIDVALIYNESAFAVLDYKYHTVNFGDSSITSRDILLVKGLINSSDTLFLCINHWPSRYGGYMNSQWKRKKASAILTGIIDSVCSIAHSPRIIIAGDFNDDAESESIDSLLNNKYIDRIGNPLKLINLKLCNEKPGYINGTLKYNANWHTFDQIIISESLVMKDNTCRILKRCMKVTTNKHLLVIDEKFGGYRPFRTYHGAKYINGFSDHLPVSITLEIDGE